MQARDFILKLNQREGHEKYRLPTEAEWEYAARAGSTGVYGEGNDERELGDHAWYHPNAGNTTHPVGQRRPNAWGLYDIQGNVLEWVWDKWAPNYSSATSTDPQGPTTGTLQVLRGCAWPYPALHCRLAHRIPESPIVAKHFYGFRLVRELP